MFSKWVLHPYEGESIQSYYARRQIINRLYDWIASMKRYGFKGWDR